MGNGRYWLQTLGCPKNQVDSEKLAGVLARDGYREAARPEDADLVVVNTCAFIEAAREESVEAILALADARREGARLVVTGCMAERYGTELAAALPEVDLVAPFGVSPAEAVRRPAGATPSDHGAPGPSAPHAPVPQPVALLPRRLSGDGRRDLGGFDLLELPRPPAVAPWAYVKVAEGCDRRCGFCAIPSFRGRQRSRAMGDVLDEVKALADAPSGPPLGEVVLVAQDLASYGRDRTERRGQGAPARRSAGDSPIVALTRSVAALVPRVRLLYLYPSGLTDELVDTVLATGVPYFDLSLQHVSRPHLARMRRWGDGERFLARIARIRRDEPTAAFRSSFILGYPGETEEDHDALLEFLREATLDWAGFFPYSREEGTHAADLADQVPEELALERLRECAELQDEITARRRDTLVGQRRQVLVDAPGVARTVHEAPEIDGVVQVPPTLPVGAFAEVAITAATGVDLVGEPIGADVVGAGAGRSAAGSEGGKRP